MAYVTARLLYGLITLYSTRRRARAIITKGSIGPQDRKERTCPPPTTKTRSVCCCDGLSLRKCGKFTVVHNMFRRRRVDLGGTMGKGTRKGKGKGLPLLFLEQLMIQIEYNLSQLVCQVCQCFVLCCLVDSQLIDGFFSVVQTI